MKRRLLNVLAAMSLLLFTITVISWMQRWSTSNNAVVAFRFGDHEGGTITFADGFYVWNSGRVDDSLFDTPADHFSYSELAYPTKQEGSMFEGSIQRRFLGFGAGAVRDPYYLHGVLVPYWFLVCIGLIAPAYGLKRDWRARIRVKHGLCATCGYDLRATPGRCPECGTIPNKTEAKP